jgi:hypothetical protein
MMGGGMMMDDCNHAECDDGFIYAEKRNAPEIQDSSKNDHPVKIDKRSKTYKTAHKELTALGMDSAQAHKELEAGLQ